jgi:hypothetical protein
LSQYQQPAGLKTQDADFREYGILALKPSQRYLKFGRCGSNALPIDGRAAQTAKCGPTLMLFRLLRRRKYLKDKSTRFRAVEFNMLIRKTYNSSMA